MNRGRHKSRSSLEKIVINFYKKYPRAKYLFMAQDLLKILCYQKECENPPDLEVFINKYTRGSSNKGFNWGDTAEGNGYWQRKMENFSIL